MLNFTLEEVFGVGASQDEDSLTIQKASLVSLTPSVQNTAESLLVAILLTLASRIRGRLETEGGEVLKTSIGQTITFNNSGLYQRADCYPFSLSLVQRGTAQYYQWVIVLHFWLSPVIPFDTSFTPELINYAD